MFQEKQVLYFKPFYFNNGNTCKNKYFIVLRNINNKSVVATLPTSKDNAPGLTKPSHGCGNLDDRMYSCYIIEKGRCVCCNGFSFPRQTYIYGNQVDTLDVDIVEETYKIKNVDYEEIDVLTDEEYNAIVKCIMSSPSAKGKIKRLLSASK